MSAVAIGAVAAWLGLVLLAWTGLCLGVGRWGRGFELPLPSDAGGGAEPVAVCLPARNEALNLDACLLALRALRWPDLRIVVVDDRSTDQTPHIAAKHAAADRRVEVVAGTEPPPGWAGKPWACQRAAQAAGSAPLLAFVDADVRVHPDALAALVPALRGQRAQLASAFGSWEVETWWERLLVPAIGWLIRGSVDLEAVNDPGRPEAFANGQLILVDRRAYDALGGHEAVKAEVLDDVKLARAFKRAGGGLVLRHAPWMFRARLYRSLHQIVEGYSKNLYEGLGRRPGVALVAVLLLLACAVLPPMSAPIAAGLWLSGGGPAAGLVTLLGAANVAIQVLYRYRLERSDGRSGAIAWAHPLANLLLVWVLLRSATSRSATWKGRRFVAGQSAP